MSKKIDLSFLGDSLGVLLMKGDKLLMLNHISSIEDGGSPAELLSEVTVVIDSGVRYCVNFKELEQALWKLWASKDR